MTIPIIIVVVVVVAALMLLSGGSPFQQRPREEFLRELEKMLNNKFEPIEGKENSFRLEFKFEGEDFVFEDFIQAGFKGEVNEAYLKVKMPSKFSLTFSERKKESVVRSDLIIASDIEVDAAKTDKKVKLPKGFERLQVYSNNINLANKIFADEKAAKVFRGFINIDSRGFPSVSVRIIDGVLTLDFHSSAALNPTLRSLRNNIPSIEDFCDKLLVIVKKIREQRDY